METGQFGHLGVLVVVAVEEEIKHKQETAVILYQHLVAKTAVLPIWIQQHRLATVNYALLVNKP